MGSFVFKIILVGDYGVGKSTSIHRFIENKFKANYVPTLGVQITKKSIIIEENNIDLLIWDLAGQDRYATVRQRFYTDTEGILMLYDVTRKSSLENIKKWHAEVSKYTKPVPIILIGNKIDLVDEREVTDDDVTRILEENNIRVRLKIETSAKEGVKTEEAFHFLVKTLMQKYHQSDFF
ncbi:MAG: Rab family GTPase [Candidatus Lokiarchaeia archaeon]